jgi:hypothetical protein
MSMKLKSKSSSKPRGVLELAHGVIALCWVVCPQLEVQRTSVDPGHGNQCPRVSVVTRAPSNEREVKVTRHLRRRAFSDLFVSDRFVYRRERLVGICVGFCDECLEHSCQVMGESF